MIIDVILFCHANMEAHWGLLQVAMEAMILLDSLHVHDSVSYLLYICECLYDIQAW